MRECLPGYSFCSPSWRLTCCMLRTLCGRYFSPPRTLSGKVLTYRLVHHFQHRRLKVEGHTGVLPSCHPHPLEVSQRTLGKRMVHLANVHSSVVDLRALRRDIPSLGPQRCSVLYLKPDVTIIWGSQEHSRV